MLLKTIIYPNITLLKKSVLLFKPVNSNNNNNLFSCLWYLLVIQVLPHKFTRHFRPWIPTNSDRFRPFPTYPTGRSRVENKRKLFFYDFQNSDQFRPIPTIFRPIPTYPTGRDRSENVGCTTFSSFTCFRIQVNSYFKNSTVQFSIVIGTSIKWYTLIYLVIYFLCCAFRIKY